ncbi:NUDIX hydrolase [Evansella clarkii]|uniref:NUDIX hydrolase n=1 Tax=Evansella clarkii TaxID=79879 RepID=UPI000B43805D|nr:NUDIX domain-containing protein [Evansella clarkii]
MKKVFGKKINRIDYEIRKGVYAVIFNSKKDKVLTVQNEKGHYFLPGGGIEDDESHTQCLARELLEETGYDAFISTYLGSAMRYFYSADGKPCLSQGYFYLAKLSKKKQKPIEDDHLLKWLEINFAKQLLIHEHHYWAVEKGVHG